MNQTKTLEQEAADGGDEWVAAIVVRTDQGELLIQMTSPRQKELELEAAGAAHNFQIPSEGARFAFTVVGRSASGFVLTRAAGRCRSSA